MASIIIPGRRVFLASIGGAAFFSTKGLFAAALTVTAETTEGPFYPDKMPLDTDNDLILLNDSITPAVGEVTWLSGRVLTAAGAPVRNAFIEIWQCDAKQSYLHTAGRSATVDGNFQGYGRYLTDSTGRYIFRTIKPVPYKLQNISRAPHIHFAISRNGKRLFTTQLAIRGHKLNDDDRVFKPLKPEAFKTIVADFVPLPGSRAGELTASFDLVLGKTAAEDEGGTLRGGIGKKVWTGSLDSLGQQRR
jgi:protocatechuate 3,4-dioxygenase, beta subunit